MKLSSWEERIAACTKIITEITSLPPDELNSAANSFFNKIQAADTYKPSTSFHGEICLFKATDNDLDVGEDYGLSTVINNYFLV